MEKHLLRGTLIIQARSHIFPVSDASRLDAILPLCSEHKAKKMTLNDGWFIHRA